MRGRVPLEDVRAVLELLVNLRLTLQPQTVGLQALLRRVALRGLELLVDLRLTLQPQAVGNNAGRVLVYRRREVLPVGRDFLPPALAVMTPAATTAPRTSSRLNQSR